MSLVLPPFYGGSGADLGTVSGLNPATFGDFVKEVLGNPALVTNVSRKEFLAQPKPKRQQAKRVPYFTAATFNALRCARLTENATRCNLICLDIDESRDALPLVSRPAILREKLTPFAFAAYTTASSTPEAPRLRVVVSADGLPVDRYADAVRYLAMVLGLPLDADGLKESKVAVQPMYLPTLFRDDDPVSDHPLVVAVPEGAAVTVATLAGASVESSAPSRQPEEIKDDAGFTLEFLRPPVDGLTVEDAEDALSHLDPDCTYSDWVEIAAALRHQFTGREADTGFRLFDEWSAKGAKYTDSEDTRRKWDSFRVSPRGRVPVTFRSVLKRAADAGWLHADAVGSRCYDATRTWILHSGRTARDLMAEGPARIVATPLVSELQRGALLSVLWDAMKVHNLNITRTELRAAVMRIERAVARAAAKPVKSSTPDAQMPPWARGLCYVAGQDEFYQRHSGRKFTPPVLDNFFSVQLMTNADEGTSQPAVRPRDFLLNTLKCPRVDDYTYDPSSSEPILQEGKRRTLNLYIPTHPDPDPSTAEAAGQVFWDHVCHLVKNPAHRKTLVDYLAYHVQHPGQKIRWTVVLQGAEGCGKTALAEAMRAVLGSQHVLAINAELVFTGYNGWATGKQLVAVEEIRVVGHNRYEVMNNLKPCITNDYISVNEKYITPYQTKNVTNYLMFTNHQDALAIGEGDRRYFVLFSELQSKAQIRALGEGYFDRLFKVINTQAAGLRAWFEGWPISDEFNPHGHAPDTEFRAQMVRNAAPPVNTAILELVEEAPQQAIQPDILSSTALAAEIEFRRLGQYPDRAITSALSELGYTFVDRVMIENSRHRVYAHRSCRLNKDEVKARFIARMSHGGLLE